jgi:hypothetical protein
VLRPVWGLPRVRDRRLSALWLYTGIFHHAFEWLIVPLVAAVVIAMWPRSRMTMIYDGGCGICRATMAWVVSFDWSRRVRVLDLHRWDEVKGWPPISTATPASATCTP